MITVRLVVELSCLSLVASIAFPGVKEKMFLTPASCISHSRHNTTPPPSVKMVETYEL